MTDKQFDELMLAVDDKLEAMTSYDMPGINMKIEALRNGWRVIEDGWYDAAGRQKMSFPRKLNG